METKPYYQRKLQDALAERVQRNARYSLRAFAKLLQMDPGTFSQILAGRRFPSVKLCQRLFQHLDLSPEEQSEFLKSLAEARAVAGLKRFSPDLRKILKEGTSSVRPRELSADLYRTIGDWYHNAILELPFTKDFKSDPKWIAKVLGISVAETHSAIERLISLELLERDESGELRRCDAQLTTGDRHLTTAAHRRRQKQILTKSAESLENDPIEERNHTAMTFAIDSKKIPEAKARIARFMAEMTEFLEAGERDRVYEMTVNLFPIQTRIPASPENESEGEVP